MSTTAASRQTDPHRPFSRRQSVSLVFCCTLLGAAAQVLMKHGANHLGHPGIVGMITNPSLLGGYCLYGISTMLLVLALRDGELSLLYPIIALTYVWVTVLSVMLFNETLGVFKALGVSIIVLGVAVLGKGGKQ